MKLTGVSRAVGAVVVEIAVLVSLGQVQGAQGSMVGKKAPDFHIQGIYDENYSLESFKGHILVMQFGASW